jgi:hypothetical protein
MRIPYKEVTGGYDNMMTRYQRKYYVTHKAVIAVKSKERRSFGYSKRKALITELKRIYNIPFSLYTDLIVAQCGKCPICLDQLTGKPALDHNHITNQIRRILCGKCNRGLGFFNDNPTLLRKAADYLVWHHAEPVLSQGR